MNDEKDTSYILPPELQMAMEQLSREATPISFQSLDSPDKIIKDLVETEKQIAEETVRMLKVRFEREKEQWKQLHAEKERELLATKGKLLEQEQLAKHLHALIRENDDVQIEHAKRASQDMENVRMRERKKWEDIAEEVRRFREMATGAQDRLNSEKERVEIIKKTFRVQEDLLSGQVQELQDEVLSRKEQLARQEELFLREKSASEGEISRLNDALTVLRQETDTQVNEKTRVLAKRDDEIAKLQDALQQLIIQLNAERQAKDSYAAQIALQEKQIADLVDEQKRLLAQRDVDSRNWQKILDDERQAWERFRGELTAKEVVGHVEIEQQIRQIQEALQHIEGRMPTNRPTLPKHS